MNHSPTTVFGKLCYELRRTPFGIAIIIFFLISMLMRRAGKGFRDESLLSSIQFGFDKSCTIFKNEWSILLENSSYKAWFFYPDMLFMLSVFLLIMLIYKRLKKARYKKYVSYKFFYWIFCILGILSIATDVYENFQYLYGPDSILPYLYWIDTVKESLIAILLALTVLYALLHFSDSGKDKEKIELQEGALVWNPKRMIVALKGSVVSVLLLVVIGFGLTLLDQGATLVVHLLDQVKDNPLGGFPQIIMTVILINLLAVIISHYPEYLQNALDPNSKVRWHINRVFGMFPGLITYAAVHFDPASKDKSKEIEDSSMLQMTQKAATYDKQDTKSHKYGNFVTLFRYYLGVMTYVAWFYVVYKAFDLYGLTDWDAGSSVFLWSIFVCMIIYYLYKAHSKDSKDIMNDIKSLKKEDPSKSKDAVVSAEAIKKVRPWLRGYIAWFVITVVLGLISLYTFYADGWHASSFTITTLFLLSNTFLYIFFRFTRQYQKYAWFDSDFVKKLLVKDHESSYIGNSKINLVLEHDFKSNFFHRLLGLVSSNYYFLYYICVITIISLVYLVSSYFTMGGIITSYSAIPMTLAFLLIAYILIIYPIKFYLAYSTRRFDEKTEHTEKPYFIRKKRFLWAVCSILTVLFIFNKIGQRENVHKLFYVESTDAISIDSFANNLNRYVEKELVDDCTLTPLLNITSFGGGLKSNLWTLLTMDALDDRVKAHDISKNSRSGTSTKRILDNTISLSGVSGGAVGLGNYLVLDYMDRITGPDVYQRDTVIKKIGLENVLAIDVSGIFGHDRIKQVFSSRASGTDPNKDRSYYAMQRYMKVLKRTNNCADIQDISSSSMSEFWSKMKEGVDHNPALIINTASTGYQPGVSLSLSYNSTVFPGYIQLSDTTKFRSENKYRDLKYYDAVSTSNRFPIMSPAGQIEDAGFFLDGGYFENSGLMTSGQFHNHLKSYYEAIRKIPTGTVVIINGKSDYVRRFIVDHDIEQTNIKGASNSAAIISGITNIDKLPNVLLSTEATYSDRLDSLFTIYLPHPISIDDIKASLGGDFEITEEIYQELVANNELIAKALHDIEFPIETKGIVVPPLARTLSSPAVEYQRAMINCHPDVAKQLDSVISYVTRGIKFDCPETVVEYNTTNNTANNAQEMQEKPVSIFKNIPDKRVFKKAIKPNLSYPLKRKGIKLDTTIIK